MFFRPFLFLFISFFFIQCASDRDVQPPGTSSPKNYWYDQGAEITRYKLKQARYGEIHRGEAVLIFVTEPFLKTKQVKADDPSHPDAIAGFKLNFIKKFPTGIYPYSIMSSHFSSLEEGDTGTLLKLTTSVQEWCGNVFMQLNRLSDGYRFSLKSYFESEGDVEKILSPALIEDQIWSLIRLSPDKLPVGNFHFIPSTEYLRLSHAAAEPAAATASLLTSENTSTYTISYPSLQRKLSIEFETDFPHRILSWKESYPSGEKKERLTTTAHRTHSILSPYWSKNKLKDLNLRKKLGLQY